MWKNPCDVAHICISHRARWTFVKGALKNCEATGSHNMSNHGFAGASGEPMYCLIMAILPDKSFAVATRRCRRRVGMNLKWSSLLVAKPKMIPALTRRWRPRRGKH
jgi:hypothetical protein